MPETSFLDRLDAAAAAAQQAELACRDQAARQIAQHERQRQFAFRRADLARQLCKAVQAAAEDAAAQAAAQAALRDELGWHGWSEARERVLTAFEPVLLAIIAATRPAAMAGQAMPDADVAAALSRFESWYEAEQGSPFLALFDVEMPELPLVEF